MVWRTITITVLTCFLLGTTFTHWIVDHNVMWTSPVTLEALERSIKYYSLLASCPDGLGWAYVAVGVTAILSAGGQLSTVLKGGDSEVLFDGGSAVLLAGVTYVQLSSVFPSVLIMPTRFAGKAATQTMYPALESAARELASDNIMCAVMLTGVLFLQAGRYYSKTATIKERIKEAELKAQAQAPALEPPPRTSTPFRELTEEEAMELKGLNEVDGAEGLKASR